MNIYFKVALRNVIRHFKRNLSIGISIAFSVGLLYAVLALSSGIKKQLIHNLVHLETGALSFSFEKKILKGDTHIK